uniref:LRRN4 C-terminal like n=1 Tax=Pelodiscus sinensis TaxID=13735 RepID=K7EYX6_PELSI|nr:LRRN4 C-terminal-like protein [Pelodiscus sinensis]|eukprot:XP_006118286.1 LRRN4 C-terminal-like protein [Pelodiscus sinensis]
MTILLGLSAPVLTATCLLILCPGAAPTSMGGSLPLPPKGQSHWPWLHAQASSPLVFPTSQDDLETDYYSYEDFTQDTPKMPGSQSPPDQPCDYHRCRHLQPACAELSRETGCLCPGVTGPGVPPEPPQLGTVHITESGASLHWCAPSSTVREYRVMYQADGEPPIAGPIFNSTFRMAALGGLCPSTSYLVCIIAANQAGASPTDSGSQAHGPCRTIRTLASQQPYAYVAAGLAAMLCLVVVAALIWHFALRVRRRQFHGSRDNILNGEVGPAGVANGSYGGEEQL